MPDLFDRDHHRPQRNPGRNPFEGNDSPPLVDLLYRCGVVARCVEPHKRRWKQWPEGPHDFDIASWKVSESKSYEVVWPDSDRSLEGGDAASGSVHDSAGRKASAMTSNQFQSETGE